MLSHHRTLGFSKTHSLQCSKLYEPQSMSSHLSCAPQNLRGRGSCACGKRENSITSTYVDDFHCNDRITSKFLKYLKRTMDRSMRSTVSLLVSRCLIPSLRFIPRNQKRIELSQNHKLATTCAVCSEADPPPKQQCRRRMGRSFLKSMSSIPYRSCEYLRRCQYPKKRTTLMPDVAQAQGKKYILATWLAINTPGWFSCFLSLLSFSDHLACDFQKRIVAKIWCREFENPQTCCEYLSENAIKNGRSSGMSGVAGGFAKH